MMVMTNREHSRLIMELLSVSQMEAILGREWAAERKRVLLGRLPAGNDWHLVEGVL